MRLFFLLCCCSLPSLLLSMTRPVLVPLLDYGLLPVLDHCDDDDYYCCYYCRCYCDGLVVLVLVLVPVMVPVLVLITRTRTRSTSTSCMITLSSSGEDTTIGPRAVCSSKSKCKQNLPQHRGGYLRIARKCCCCCC